MIINYPKVLLGYNNDLPIFLSPPSWDCGWYWGWGYLENKDCYYHVEGLKKIQTYNHKKEVQEYEFCDLKTGFDKHFGDSFIIKETQRWEFAELFQSFYYLKNIAEVYNRGGSHLTINPCSELIKNINEVKRINEILLPKIFEETYKIIENGKYKY